MQTNCQVVIELNKIIDIKLNLAFRIRQVIKQPSLNLFRSYSRTAEGDVVELVNQSSARLVCKLYIKCIDVHNSVRAALDIIRHPFTRPLSDTFDLSFEQPLHEITVRIVECFVVWRVYVIQYVTVW